MRHSTFIFFFSSTNTLPRISSSPQPKISLMFQTNDSKPKGGARGELRRSRVQVTQRTWNADIMWVTHHGTRTSPATATFDSLINSSSLLMWRMVLFLVFCCSLFIFCQTRWEYAWSVEMWSEGGWEWMQNWWKKKMLRDVDSKKEKVFFSFFLLYFLHKRGKVVESEWRIQVKKGYFRFPCEWTSNCLERNEIFLRS